MKRRILESAREEFCIHSYSGARIDRISKNAETTDRMLYYHFGNKEALYQIVLEDLYKEIVLAQKDFKFTENNPSQAMQEIIEQIWQYYLSHPNFIRIVMSENLLYGEFFSKSEKIRQAPLGLLEKTEYILNQGKHSGLFKTDAKAEFVLLTIMSMGFFYVGHQYTCSQWLEKDMMSEESCQQWLKNIKMAVLQTILK
ncbi:TetR family transcriptional regulator [Acinetobacter haemolyticus]|uniref:TetR/AcrR family transcriptional regulator n=1 Tax=Acinetobacter haemolyticus TaxID=29430 RepID=UPI0013BEF8CA|nr:TetR/AcrR family transcriptional regulator [Acinetobacter haemolyticus]NAR28614.1 TetR family transcriptional regulator [Acinetobacter haemolyticus]NAR62386.1 TetR family transcriptional regulator [Acinetobacter haemolyticus]